ncbi:MAG: RNA-directed DNA polymerase [Bacteroidetes bacterium]|nr:RNA-directed DNA polymerase [Bacteroidota bacterium]
MKKFGFWNETEGQSSLPEQLIMQEARLSKELYDLLEKQRKYQDREKALKEMRTARLQKSREKIAENKRLRKEKKEQRAQDWKNSKQKDIIYLGPTVSKGLQQTADGESDKLKQKQLPLIHTAEELASQMGIGIGELRFLSYNRPVSTVSHYRQFQMPKKTGGFRKISAPMPKLKEAQHWILHYILNKLPVHENAHGFTLRKSIVTNAQPHLQKVLLINIDLKDFFPSIHYPRVKGMFRGMGYNEKIATLLALICTESETDEVELDGKKYFVKSGNRALPQGAPTSPAITNYLCRRLDARLSGLARKYHFTYTRYADDMTFSFSADQQDSIKTCIGFIKKTIRTENFNIHPDKFKVLRKGARHEVTGVVVNNKLSVDSKKLKKFRATLYQIEKHGLQGKHWNHSHNLLASLKGYANFINQVDPVKGKIYTERVRKILDQYQYRHEIIFKPKPKPSPLKEIPNPIPAPEAKTRKPWWKFW